MNFSEVVEKARAVFGKSGVTFPQDLKTASITASDRTGVFKAKLLRLLKNSVYLQEKLSSHVALLTSSIKEEEFKKQETVQLTRDFYASEVETCCLYLQNAVIAIMFNIHKQSSSNPRDHRSWLRFLQDRLQEFAFYQREAFLVPKYGEKYDEDTAAVRLGKLMEITNINIDVSPLPEMSRDILSHVIEMNPAFNITCITWDYRHFFHYDLIAIVVPDKSSAVLRELLQNEVSPLFNQISVLPIVLVSNDEKFPTPWHNDTVRPQGRTLKCAIILWNVLIDNSGHDLDLTSRQTVLNLCTAWTELQDIVSPSFIHIYCGSSDITRLVNLPNLKLLFKVDTFVPEEWKGYEEYCYRKVNANITERTHAWDLKRKIRMTMQPSPRTLKMSSVDPALSFETEGWCALSMALSSEQIFECNNAITAAIKRHTDALKRLLDPSGEFTNFKKREEKRWDITVPEFLQQEFAFLNRNSMWREIIQCLMGTRDVRCIHAGCILSAPGSSDQGWHTDGKLDNMDAINVFIPLIDMTMELGPTEFIPKTQSKTGDEIDEMLDGLKDGRKANNSVQPLLIAGQPLLFDYRLIHRGVANKSSVDRRVVYLTYGREKWHDNMNFSTANYRPEPRLPEQSSRITRFMRRTADAAKSAAATVANELSVRIGISK